MKFIKISSKRTYVFVQDEKNSNLRSYNIIESWSGAPELSTLLLSNSIAIFGVFARENLPMEAHQKL